MTISSNENVLGFDIAVNGTFALDQGSSLYQRSKRHQCGQCLAFMFIYALVQSTMRMIFGDKKRIIKTVTTANAKLQTARG